MAELTMARTRCYEALNKSIDVALELAIELATCDRIKMEWAQQLNMEYDDEVRKIEESQELRLQQEQEEEESEHKVYARRKPRKRYRYSKKTEATRMKRKSLHNIPTPYERKLAAQALLRTKSFYY